MAWRSWAQDSLSRLHSILRNQLRPSSHHAWAPSDRTHLCVGESAHAAVLSGSLEVYSVTFGTCPRIVG